MRNKIAITLIAMALLATGFWASRLPQLEFNYQFESFFPDDDPELYFYQRHARVFDTDNDFLLVGLYHESGIFDSIRLQAAEQLANWASRQPGVTEVISPTRLKKTIIGPMGKFEVPLLRWETDSLLRVDKERIMQEPWIAGQFIDNRGESLLIQIQHAPNLTKEKGDELVYGLDQVLQKMPFNKSYVAGKLKAQRVYISKMQRELIVFVTVSVFLVMVVLFLMYRSLWSSVLPLVVVLLAVIWTTGIMAVTGKSLDIMMVLLPSILFVVGMSDVVHIKTRYLEELRSGVDKFPALLTVIREVGLATFLTSLTTATGFLTLLTASIKPIREFGLYTAIGVMIAFFLAFLLYPLILWLRARPPVAYRDSNRIRWRRWLSRMLQWVFSNRKTIPWVAVGFSLAIGSGIAWLQVNSYLIDDIPHDDPLKKAFLFFDQTYGGSKPLEISMTHTAGADLLQPEYMPHYYRIDSFLTHHYGASQVVSVAALASGLNQSLQGGNPEAFKAPNDVRVFRVLRLLKRSPGIHPIVSKNRDSLRIRALIPDIGSRVSARKNDSLQTFLNQELRGKPIAAHITGTTLLIDRNNTYLVSNVVTGLGIAFGVVAFITGIMFRSWRMVGMILLVNGLPLLVIAGIMGLAGIDLKLSTSIIFAIAFGIAVDDSIHFISKLRLELFKGKSLPYAIKRTFMSTGKSIMVTTLILITGFFSLLFSSFGGTFYTGLLVGLTLILALLADLILLPVLLLGLKR